MDLSKIIKNLWNYAVIILNNIPSPDEAKPRGLRPDQEDARERDQQNINREFANKHLPNLLSVVSILISLISIIISIIAILY